MENNENNYPPGSYYPNNPGQFTPQPENQPNGLAVGSMIVGIVSLIFCCIPPLQFILGVVGILLVIFSKRGRPWSGFAVAGLVLSIIAILISIAMIVYMIAAFQMMKDPQYAPFFNDIYQMYETMSIR